jgi:hypothetical protein
VACSALTCGRIGADPPYRSEIHADSDDMLAQIADEAQEIAGMTETSR